MIAKLLWIKRNNQDHQIEVILDYNLYKNN